MQKTQIATYWFQNYSWLALLVVSNSGAASIPKDAKLTNAHSSSSCVNCLGVVASFATKIKESSSTLLKISQTKMKKQPIVSYASTKMAEEFLAHIQLSPAY